jgi:PIN domain nuclease of toxin-antitoxin system
MRYLLDTNVLIYMLSAPAEISPEAKRIVQTEEHLFVSFASLWEIAIKQGLGKLNIELNIPGIEEQCEIRGIRMLSLSSDAIERIKMLPDIHRDPFDRMLIAQAIEDSLTIVTRDRIIPQYQVPTIW